MKAAVLYQTKQPLVVEELDLLEPRAGEVLVRYVASGVCHSDLHVVEGLMGHPLPVVLGHEGAGVVEEVGPGVTRVKPGDHVLTSYIPYCGTCRFCAVGRPNLCTLRDSPRHVMLDGTTRFHKNGQEIYQLLQVGSYAQRAVLLEQGVVPIRKDAPLDVVCLVSCGVMTGVGAAINRAKVAPGSSVAVVGCGGVGLNVIQGARLAGAARIVAVDSVRFKLELAQEFGATHLVDALHEDPVSRVREITGGWGADYSFEVIGKIATMEQAFDMVHRGGTVVIVGVAPDGARLAIDPRMLLQEKVLTGTSFGSARQQADLPMLVDLYMEGKLKLNQLISARRPLEEINEAFEALNEGEVARTVLVYE